jgi:hypothetical protein
MVDEARREKEEMGVDSFRHLQPKPMQLPYNLMA